MVWERFIDLGFLCGASGGLGSLFLFWSYFTVVLGAENDQPCRIGVDHGKGVPPPPTPPRG